MSINDLGLLPTLPGRGQSEVQQPRGRWCAQSAATVSEYGFIDVVRVYLLDVRRPLMILIIVETCIYFERQVATPTDETMLT